MSRKTKSKVYLKPEEIQDLAAAIYPRLLQKGCEFPITEGHRIGLSSIFNEVQKTVLKPSRQVSGLTAFLRPILMTRVNALHRSAMSKKGLRPSARDRAVLAAVKDDRLRAASNDDVALPARVSTTPFNRPRLATKEIDLEGGQQTSAFTEIGKLVGSHLREDKGSLKDFIVGIVQSLVPAK